MAVDFGTSSTCVAVSVRGREPQVVVVDGNPLMSSAVYAGPDGTLFVGQEADRQAAVDPSRYEPHPKRRIDEGELLLGDAVRAVPDVIRAVLTRAVGEARRIAGGAGVDQLVLTHPADWGGVRTGVLRTAAAGLAATIELVPEPVAAAVFHTANFPASGGAPLAVFDLGGGTVDVSVVRATGADRRGPTYQVLATRGEPNFGGADIDQLLLEHIGAAVSRTDATAWRALTEGRELADRRRRRVLRADVRGAKESLSRHPYTDIPMPSPFPDAHVTRADLERLIGAPVGRAVDLALRTLADAGLRATELSGIFLVGGSSRIPIVARLLYERGGLVPTSIDQPETVVARGALRAVPAPTGPPSGPVPVSPPGGRPGPGGPTGPPSGPIAVSAPAGPPRGPAPRPIATAPRPTHPARPAARRSRTPWALVGVVALIAAIGTGVLLALRENDSPVCQTISAYDYQFCLPDAWKQTPGGRAETRGTEIKPSDAEQGGDLVLVQETPLRFDSEADRTRAVDALREQFQSRGSDFSDFRDSATFGGKQVVSYRQALRNKDATVAWYALFQGNVQVSVGCQYTSDGERQVLDACHRIVESMTIRG